MTEPQTEFDMQAAKARALQCRLKLESIGRGEGDAGVYGMLAGCYHDLEHAIAEIERLKRLGKLNHELALVHCADLEQQLAAKDAEISRLNNLIYEGSVREECFKADLAALRLQLNRYQYNNLPHDESSEI